MAHTRREAHFFVCVLCLVGLLGGCGSGGADTPGGAGNGSGGGGGGGSGPIEITLFHTSDEHGWLERQTDNGWTRGGAADVAGWLAADGFDEAHALLVSGGDNWVGPAISSYFRGESTIDVFNAMGYVASAIGNHEFDLGQPLLAERVAQAHYPYLGANVRIAATDELPSYDLGHTIVSVQGVAVGLIGLTTRSTATSTNPKNVEDLEFADLLATLEAEIPAVRAEGADLVIVLAHEGYPVMAQVAEQLSLPVDAIFGGHNHTATRGVVNGIPVLESGAYFGGYTRARFRFDPETRTSSFVDEAFVDVGWNEGEAPPHEPDAAVEGIVAGWADQLDDALSESIGYSATGIAMMSWTQANWTCDAWLWAFPEAQIVIQNFGGLRQAIPSGDVRLLDLYGMMPFEDRIYELELTGAEVRANIAQATASCGTQGACSPAVAGLRYQGIGNAVVLLQPDGQPLDLDATYVVLVNDFIYEGGSGYLFATEDTTPVDLGVNHRDPVIDWTESVGSSPADPLELHVDSTPRCE